MNRDFIGALLQLNAEKGVPQDILLQTLEQAIESAYRRNAERLGRNFLGRAGSLDGWLAFQAKDRSSR